jgi:aspartate aminotransferase-like enzyme
VSSGVHGTGIGTMAEQLGASVKRVDVAWDVSFIEAVQNIRQLASEWQPELITAVHCETPCGILNHVEALGEIARDCNALYYVDFVSSGGCVPVHVYDCRIDLGLLGSQKCLNLPPDLAIVTVSARAWEVIDHVRAFGYEGLADWSPHRLTALEHVPYTLNWRAIAALECSLNDLLAEGAALYARHREVSQMTRVRLAQDLKLTLYPRHPDRDSSPTVTAVKVPDEWQWRDLDTQLRARGVVLGGSWSALSGAVFRIGHMGTQAESSRVMGALDHLQAVLHRRV